MSVCLRAPVALLSFPVKEIRCAELGVSHFQPFRPLPRLPWQDSPSLSSMSPPTPAISSELPHFFHPKQKGSHLSPFSQLPLWFLSPTLLQLFVSLNSQTLPYFLIFLLHLNRGVCVCVCVWQNTYKIDHFNHFSV